MTETPIYKMFDMIAQSGVGKLGNTSLLLLQIFLSIFVEIKFLFSAMKNRPPLVQFSISMIPMVFIATYSMVCGLFFGAFLGKGPTMHEMIEIVNVTLSGRCVLEMLSASALFFVLMPVYSVIYKLNPLQWLMTFGIETLAALSLVTLYGGLLIPNFPFTIYYLCDRDIYLGRWPIYGYFTLLFKCFVLIMSLLLGLILRERKAKPETEEEVYSDRGGYYEKRVLRYIIKGDSVVGFSFVVFGVAAEVFFVWRLLLEEGTNWNIDLIFTVMVFSALFLGLAAFGALFLYRAVFPRKSKVFCQLMAIGDRTMVLRLFCEEVVDGGAPEVSLWTTNTPIRTAHFLFWRQGIRSHVEWRGERPRSAYQRAEEADVEGG